MNAIHARTHTPLHRALGLRTHDALLVVDVQRDFLPDGALEVANGDEVVERANAYMASFAARGYPIFLTRDWHPPDHCSFRSSGGRWPEHCVQDTPGAAWAPGLTIPPSARIVSKGTAANMEAYSGFSGTALLSLLRELKVRRVFVCGLATDYCVHETVIDALSYGFEVVVLCDAIRAVNDRADGETEAIENMIGHGAVLAQRARRREASSFEPQLPQRETPSTSAESARRPGGTSIGMA
jgi:nicotinamidase/pyrazinamidase